jgi:hypothetical protein
VDPEYVFDEFVRFHGIFMLDHAVAGNDRLIADFQAPFEDGDAV